MGRLIIDRSIRRRHDGDADLLQAAAESRGRTRDRGLLADQSINHLQPEVGWVALAPSSLETFRGEMIIGPVGDESSLAHSAGRRAFKAIKGRPASAQQVARERLKWPAGPCLFWRRRDCVRRSSLSLEEAVAAAAAAGPASGGRHFGPERRKCFAGRKSAGRKRFAAVIYWPSGGAGLRATGPRAPGPLDRPSNRCLEGRPSRAFPFKVRADRSIRPQGGC